MTLKLLYARPRTRLEKLNNDLAKARQTIPLLAAAPGASAVPDQSATTGTLESGQDEKVPSSTSTDAPSEPVSSSVYQLLPEKSDQVELVEDLESLKTTFYDAIWYITCLV